MGMAASQVRFLSLQNRKNTIGLNLMTLSNRKSALSRDMNRVAAQYNAAMNEKNLKWSTDSGVTYNDLSYDLLMKPNELNASLPYIISDSKGRVVVDNSKIVIDGTKTDVSYRDLAKMISSYSGTDKNNQTTYDNLSNIKFVNGNPVSGNPSVEGYEYQIVSSVDQYDITQNSLRYDLMTKLNIISQEDRDEWLAATSAMAGNKFGEVYVNKDGSLSGLLQNYISAGLTSTASPISIELTDADGNVENVSSDKFFGKCNPDGTFIAGTGSVYGNLAVAEYELQEYKNWCGELHEVSLKNVTEHTFTGISGIELKQQVQPIISDMDAKYNNASQTKSWSNTKADGTTDTINFSTHVSDFNSWNDILTKEDSCFDVSGYDGGTYLALISNFVGKLSESFTKTSEMGSLDTTDGWSLTNDIDTDDCYVDPETITTNTNRTNGLVQSDLAQAAAEWASKRTIEYYCEIFSTPVDNGKSKDPWDKAQDSSSDYNGINLVKKKKNFWQKFAEVLSTVVAGAGIAAAILLSGGGAAAIIGAALIGSAYAGAGYAVSSDLVNQNLDKNKKAALNANNIMETYFTFYQMYIETKGNTDLLTNSGEERTVTDYSIAEDLSYIKEKTNLLTSPITDTAQRLVGTDDDGNPVHETWYVTKKSDGSIDQYLQKQSTSTSKLYVLSDGTKIEQDTFNYTYVDENDVEKTEAINTRDIYIDELGNRVDIQRDSSGWSQITYTNDAGLIIDEDTKANTEYNKIVETVAADGNVTYQYYKKNASGSYDEVTPPTKTVVTPSLSYVVDGVTKYNVSLYDTSHFANNISVYLTPKAEHLQTLNSRIAKAKEAIKNAEKERDDIFSEKEKRMMAYFDSIFKQISTKGWVYDEHINDTSRSQQQNNQYLEAMFENNMYYITEVETLDGKDFNYAQKLAHNVSHVFQVLDTDAQNAALSKYESEKTEITAKEKQLDIRINKLQTEQDAISTELQSLKKIIDDNVSNTFKIFS